MSEKILALLCALWLLPAVAGAGSFSSTLGGGATHGTQPAGPAGENLIAMECNGDLADWDAGAYADAGTVGWACNETNGQMQVVHPNRLGGVVRSFQTMCWGNHGGIDGTSFDPSFATTTMYPFLGSHPQFEFTYDDPASPDQIDLEDNRLIAWSGPITRDEVLAMGPFAAREGARYRVINLRVRHFLTVGAYTSWSATRTRTFNLLQVEDDSEFTTLATWSIAYEDMPTGTDYNITLDLSTLGAAGTLLDAGTRGLGIEQDSESAETGVFNKMAFCLDVEEVD